MGLVTVTAAAFFKLYAKVVSLAKGKEYQDPFREYLHRDVFITESKLQKELQKIGKLINPIIQQVQHLMGGSSLIDSAKFSVKLYLLSYLTSWFSGLTLALYFLLLSFSLPIIYQKNKTIVDANVAILNGVYATVESKVGSTVG